ncbi:uncharacterized protein LOC120008829, partial [Tripterygium wilfordii]|uniref:uncharacterized protein LOC120008829 n=1 Tax=Tripterygium wilfordii TaxID=458696 RepID=UPI0018F859DF
TSIPQKEYVVDVWFGNHPFYLGSRSALLVDADQVEKFRKRFAGLLQIMEIPVLVLPSKIHFHIAQRLSSEEEVSGKKKKLENVVIQRLSFDAILMLLIIKQRWRLVEVAEGQDLDNTHRELQCEAGPWAKPPKQGLWVPRRKG